MVTINVHNWREATCTSPAWLPENEEQILWEEYQVRTGIKLLVQNRPSLPSPLEFDFKVATAPMEFMYCVSGSTRLSITDKHGKRLCAATTPDTYTVSHLPWTRGTSITDAGQPLKAVGLQIHPDTLCRLVHESGQSVCPRLRALLSGPDPEAFFSETALPLPLQVTVTQILECQLTGSLKRFFMEYKALELVYTQLSLLDGAIARTRTLPEFEYRATMRAHALLMEDIVSPPGLQELARKVGLTHARLNKSFRTLFGNTVFGLLRLERLECARRMLEDGRRTVAEVAYECGFSSPSHLSRAFTGHYGLQPKQYRAEHLK
ncbi:helix-turn-helix transcriptional regulator [Salidesulfovibrio onnuriiensis]|uniref:helix-turn-helix transcriptional regulator n=1 Tax=Salidesulfovibrio onnuriiensis TaxID=2583823 RepID=UPI0011C7D6B0|nr:AraC family transcriptional regulator [Salidesulfovibrio onnuriiensis]